MRTQESGQSVKEEKHVPQGGGKIKVPKLANHTDEKSHSKVVEVPVL